MHALALVLHIITKIKLSIVDVIMIWILLATDIGDWNACRPIDVIAITSLFESRVVTCTFSFSWLFWSISLLCFWYLIQNIIPIDAKQIIIDMNADTKTIISEFVLLLLSLPLLLSFVSRSIIPFESVSFDVGRVVGFLVG